MLHGELPQLGHLHLFGVCAQLLLPEHKRDKLDPWGVEARYLGPTHDLSSHRMWVPGSRTTTASHNITFVNDAPSHTPTPQDDPQDDDCPTSRPVMAVDDQLNPGVDETFDESLLGNQDNDTICLELDSSITNYVNDLNLGSPPSSPPSSPRGEPTPGEHKTTDSQMTGSNKSKRPSKPPPHPPSTRTHRAPTRLIANCDLARTLSTMVEPRSFKEAMASPNAHLWLEAMTKEIRLILANATWVLMPLPNGRQAVDTRWTFKVKLHASSDIDCPKA